MITPSPTLCGCRPVPPRAAAGAGGLPHRRHLLPVSMLSIGACQASRADCTASTASSPICTTLPRRSCCTTTLAQSVNLPAERVIFRDAWVRQQGMHLDPDRWVGYFALLLNRRVQAGGFTTLAGDALRYASCTAFQCYSRSLPSHFAGKQLARKALADWFAPSPSAWLHAATTRWLGVRAALAWPHWERCFC